MRSARLRLPSNIILLVKRATLRLLYFGSGTSGRRTTFLRLGTVCLLINKLVKNPAKFTDTRKGVDSIVGNNPDNLFRTPTRGCLSTQVENTRLSSRKKVNTLYALFHPRLIVFSR